MGQAEILGAAERPLLPGVVADSGQGRKIFASRTTGQVVRVQVSLAPNGWGRLASMTLLDD